MDTDDHQTHHAESVVVDFHIDDFCVGMETDAHLTE